MVNGEFVKCETIDVSLKPATSNLQPETYKTISANYKKHQYA